jgi:hypothetical protein
MRNQWLDGDCPDGVLCIMDHPEFGDRYTVIYREDVGDGKLWGRGMSPNPCHPHGIGMSFEVSAQEVAAYCRDNRRYRTKWSSLPEAVRELVKRDLTPSRTNNDY